MANKITYSYVKFKKVSGFNPGPLKPTVTSGVEVIPNEALSVIENNMTSDLPNLAKGETIQIVLTAGDTIPT